MDENEHRVPLSQFELAQSVKKRYDVLSEDLVENPECPECDKRADDFKGIDGFLGHVSSAHNIDDPYDDSSVVLKTRIIRDILMLMLHPDVSNGHSPPDHAIRIRPLNALPLPSHLRE